MAWTEEQIRKTLTLACSKRARMERPELPLPALLNTLIDGVVEDWKHQPGYDPMFGFASELNRYAEMFGELRERVEELDPNLHERSYVREEDAEVEA